MKTNYGYKLFEQNANGELFPLFINKNEPLEIGKWLHAEFYPTKGYASRGGWHIGADVPDAPWLKSYDGTEIGFYKPRWKTGKRVWCLVEYNATHNYDDEISQLKEKCFMDRVPDNGFYLFRESGKGVWVITSDIRIVKIISDEEREKIMRDKGYNEAESFSKYKKVFEKKIKNKNKYYD